MAKLASRFWHRGPAPKPQCKFGESSFLGENTYEMTEKDTSMTDNLIQKLN